MYWPLARICPFPAWAAATAAPVAAAAAAAADAAAAAAAAFEVAVRAGILYMNDTGCWLGPELDSSGECLRFLDATGATTLLAAASSSSF